MKIETRIDGKWIGICNGNASSTKIGAIGRVADKNCCNDKHGGSNREGNDVTGCFFEPFAKCFTPGECIKKQLNGGCNKLDYDHNIAFDKCKKKFEAGNSEGDRDYKVHDCEGANDATQDF